MLIGTHRHVWPGDKQGQTLSLSKIYLWVHIGPSVSKLTKLGGWCGHKTQLNKVSSVWSESQKGTYHICDYSCVRANIFLVKVIFQTSLMLKSACGTFSQGLTDLFPGFPSQDGVRASMSEWVDHWSCLGPFFVVSCKFCMQLHQHSQTYSIQRLDS